MHIATSIRIRLSRANCSGARPAKPSPRTAPAAEPTTPPRHAQRLGALLIRFQTSFHIVRLPSAPTSHQSIRTRHSPSRLALCFPTSARPPQSKRGLRRIRHRHSRLRLHELGLCLRGSPTDAFAPEPGSSTSPLHHTISIFDPSLFRYHPLTWASDQRPPFTTVAVYSHATWTIEFPPSLANITPNAHPVCAHQQSCRCHVVVFTSH
jgi:hypothetical protein